MKMFLIVYCDAADEDVIDTFKKNEIRAYTKMREDRGVGTETEPKLGTSCWPGKNHALFISLRKTPGFAGGLTEFDGSGNRSSTLA